MENNSADRWCTVLNELEKLKQNNSGIKLNFNVEEYENRLPDKDSKISDLYKRIEKLELKTAQNDERF